MATLLLYESSMSVTKILTIALLTLVAVPAAAQPGSTAPGQTTPQAAPPAPYLQQYQPEITTTSYGWQVFAVDAATWVAIAASDDGDNGFAAVGAMGLFLGGPIVHLAQGNSGGAGYSLLARTGLPLGGALLGAAACDEDGDDFACLGSMMLGTSIGYGSALLIDWFYLAEKTKVTGPHSGWASVRPSLQVEPSGAKAGVAFNF